MAKKKKPLIPNDEKMTARKIDVAPPGIYSGAEIREMRVKMAVSQPMFAKLLGASTASVAHWEDGTSIPSTIARRLFDVIRRDPLGYFNSLATLRQ